MTRRWHLYDAVTHEKNNVMKIFINQEESLILRNTYFLLLAHAQTFDRCVGEDGHARRSSWADCKTGWPAVSFSNSRWRTVSTVRTKVLKIAVCAKDILLFTESKPRPNCKYFYVIFPLKHTSFLYGKGLENVPRVLACLKSVREG